MKPAKLDATALHDDTLANSVPPSEACNHAVLACGLGIPEEHYVSEAVEDAPSCRGYRDACTITGQCTVLGFAPTSKLREMLSRCRRWLGRGAAQAGC